MSQSTAQPNLAIQDPNAATGPSGPASSASAGAPSGGSSGEQPKRRRVAVDMRQWHDRLPPHAEQAERWLLGAMILDHRVIGEVLQYVKSRDDFYTPKHGEIFDALRRLYDEKNAGDVAMLYQALLDRGVAEDIGGPEYLEDLAASTPIAANAVHYAEMVAKKSTLRRMIHASQEIMQAAYGDPDDVSEVLDLAQKTVFEVLHQADRHDAESLASLLKATMEVIQSRDQGEVITGLATGFRDLDEMTSGLQSGEMLVLAARPSMGKTAFALNVAENVALDGHAVGVFSLEMSRQQLAQRLLCSRSEVDSHRLRRNMINKEDYRRLSRAVGELSEAPIFIDDSPGLSILELRAKARRMSLQHGIKLVLVDYLQLLRGSSRESRQQEVAEISRGIKALARELEIPVVCLSQLNRASEVREDHRPRMSDLRESGSIEQDADAVLMLHREEYYHNEPEWAENNPDKVGLAELIISKQRNGPTGTVELTWVGANTKFKDHYRGGPAPGEAGFSGRGEAGFSGRGEAGFSPPGAAGRGASYTLGWAAPETPAPPRPSDEPPIPLPPDDTAPF